MHSHIFRTIFEALALADRAAGATQPGALQAIQPWQLLLLAVAQQAASGAAITADAYGHRFRQMSRESTAGVLLGALPVLLLNSDPYGHRLPQVCQWGETLGLGKDAVSSLREWFLYLCHPPKMAALPVTNPPPPTGQWFSPNLQSGSLLVKGQNLVQQAQGQFWLSLQLAQQHGWNGAELGLIAVLAMIGERVDTLPLPLRYGLLKIDSKDCAQRQDYWHDLFQLGQELDARWRGLVCQDWFNNGRSRVLTAVTL